jgi:hypothetical protein
MLKLVRLRILPSPEECSLIVPYFLRRRGSAFGSSPNPLGQPYWGEGWRGGSLAVLRPFSVGRQTASRTTILFLSALLGTFPPIPSYKQSLSLGAVSSIVTSHELDGELLEDSNTVAMDPFSPHIGYLFAAYTCKCWGWAYCIGVGIYSQDQFERATCSWILTLINS